jgi:hypothetical protein
MQSGPATEIGSTSRLHSIVFRRPGTRWRPSPTNKSPRTRLADFGDRIRRMIRIAITPAAYAAIATTLALGTVAVEPECAADGRVHIWLDPGVLAKLQGAARPR